MRNLKGFVDLIACGISDIGKRRRDNQDYFRINSVNGFFAVADGMGGMMNGAAASKYAVDALYELLDGKISSENDISSISSVVSNAVIEMNNLLRNAMGTHTGTTIVAVLISGDTAVVVNMGDSRAYLFRDDRLSRQTEDHNLFALLSKTKRFTENELREDKTHHMLIRYAGMENPHPDVSAVPIKRGDRILLCTDGLSEMVNDEGIAETLRKAQGLKAVLHELVAKANEAGGRDNITAVILECR